MYLNKELILIGNLLLIITFATAVSIPGKCHLDDSECLTKVAQEYAPIFALGIPDINVKPSDPLLIKRCDASIGALKLIVTDIIVTGLKNTVIKRIRFDKSKSILSLKLHIIGKLDGRYEMDGNLLILPVKGNGPVHVTLGKTEVLIDIDIKEETLQDGEVRWSATYKNHSFKIKEKSHVVFENLFEGNSLLAAAANEMISQNGNEIIYEVGSPVIKAVIKQVVLNVNDFFHSMPLEDLYIK